MYTHVYVHCMYMYMCVCMCVCTGLWHILTGYGYQMISEDQKETVAVKDGHTVTLVVGFIVRDV